MILQVQNLTFTYSSNNKHITALKNINIEINQGEIFGIVGESGCGKTTLAKEILKLHNDENHFTSGNIYYKSKKLDNERIKQLRGSEIAYISQNFFSSLSNYFTIYKQFDYLLKSKTNLDKNTRRKKIVNSLMELNFENVEELLTKYPFQLSGGMIQRVVIAMALSLSPSILIADEPTSAVDSSAKKKLLDILKKVNVITNIAIILISHDLAIVKNFTQNIAIFYEGELIEKGTNSEIFSNPLHPYTKLLLESKPDMKKEYLHEKKKLNNYSSSCAFVQYCKEADNKCLEIVQEMSIGKRFVKCTRAQYVKN